MTESSFPCTTWTRHGDHPAVARYPEASVNANPELAACGVLTRKGIGYNVNPGDVIVEAFGCPYVTRPEGLSALLGQLSSMPKARS